MMISMSLGLSSAITSNSSNPTIISPSMSSTQLLMPSTSTKTVKSDSKSSSTSQKWTSKSKQDTNKSIWASQKTRMRCKSCGCRILKSTLNLLSCMANTQQNSIKSRKLQLTLTMLAILDFMVVFIEQL